MSKIFPLYVYFDASCPLCRSEMNNIKRHDKENRIQLIDCSLGHMNADDFRYEPVGQDELMQKLHVQDAAGNWYVGVGAFEIIYRSVGITIVSGVLANPILRPILDWMYPWVIRHRSTLAKIGFKKLFDRSATYAISKEKNELWEAEKQCSAQRCGMDKSFVEE